MHITLIEPFFTGSHAAWAQGYQRHSRHRIDILPLDGHHWKWRMHGGAVTLARRFLDSGARPDLLLATDMLDVTTFLALTRHRTARLPVALYFHENQIGYPWSPQDRDIAQRRDHHYGFINFSSALAADAVLFNSRYHQDSFLEALPRFLKRFPDHREPAAVAAIAAKSQVLPLGIDLRRLDAPVAEKPAGAPLILWNHRWEHDKNPEAFFSALAQLEKRGLDFQVAILGRSYQTHNTVFEAARVRLAHRIVHYGYVENPAQYTDWLHCADLLPVTSHQDFFGISLVEALYCGCYPLLPKRLSYPELVPLEKYPEVFYEDEAELVEKLAGAVQNIDAIRRRSLRHCIEAYDWQLMAPVYDALLEAVGRREA
jgi:glycosyltransferase involved in cell wall biosynthesis